MVAVRTRVIRAVLALVVGLAALTLPGLASAAEDTVGAPGAGDPYFPYSGNGGYDVRHYHLDLTYAPPEADPAPLVGRLDGVATITMVPTQTLSRFNLDLRGMDVESVAIDGRRISALEPPAPGEVVETPGFWQVQDDDARIWELVVQPRRAFRAGQHVTLEIAYGGDTVRPRDVEGALYGWVTTRDGSMVVSEPEGAMTWYPVSDHQTDKASYGFEITVPEGKTVVANGLERKPPTTKRGWTTWYWDAPDQMASYLATASVGDFDLFYSQTPGGLPIVDAIDRDLTAQQRATTDASLARQPEMIGLFESLFGPYPFNSFGSIVDDDTVGYALETQTRPFYSRQANLGTVAHELAHMWFGDAVSPTRWADIWLNEGWATYATWIWNEHNGGLTAQQAFDAYMVPARTPAYWALDISDPGPFGLFATQVYNRGAATLHALRVKVGDDAFFAGAQLWAERFDDSDASTEDFEAVFEEVSGQDLGNFFDVWLRNPVKPTAW